MSILRVAVFVAVGFAAAVTSAETYIVPVWATALPASDGEWWARATIINPNAYPVTVQIARVFPLQTSECVSCLAGRPPITILPGASATIVPPAHKPGLRLVAGAFEIETSAPVHIHLAAYRPGANEIRQRLDVARGWLLPGTRSISSVERTVNSDWRINVFIVNPNAAELRVSVWSASRAENEVQATVAPGRTAVVSLPPPRCSGVPCPVSDVYPIPLLQVHVESDGMFLASVSSVGKNWAVFSLADEATFAP